MAEKYRREPKRRREESEDTSEAVSRSEKQGSAEEVSAATDVVIEEIDDLIDEVHELVLITLGFDKDESVDDAELEERADVAFSEFIQKGGQ